MEMIKTLKTRDLCESAKNGGCGECQTSCQSACKTSCGIANQPCENGRLFRCRRNGRHFFVVWIQAAPLGSQLLFLKGMIGKDSRVFPRPQGGNTPHFLLLCTEP